MRHGLVPIEGLLSIARKTGKRSVFFCFQRFFHKIPYLERKRDPLPFGPAAEPFVQRLFQDDVDARIGCGHGVYPFKICLQNEV